jgi:pyruvate formate lyase activating enzyme
MWFGGFQPFSLSDYPGCIAAIAFAQGCNFRCRFCHNASLLPLAQKKNNLMSSEDVLAKLMLRQGKLEGVVVSGGEPTLQEDLPDFLHQVKKMGLKIKLDTNGSHPKMLTKILGGNLLDYIAMDIKAPFNGYDAMCGVPVSSEAIKTSIHLVANAGIAHHFRTTFVEALLTKADLARIKAETPDKSSHIVQVFQPRHALDPWLRPDVLEGQYAGGEACSFGSTVQ